jgi:solute carrier family 35 protein E3
MSYPVWALVIGSILTTVALVMVNKVVFSGGFPFVLTLSTMHFVATYSVMLVMSKIVGAFEPKFLPLWTNLSVAAMGVGSIGFMNYSLKFNSVGIYQMAKLCVIPVVLIYNALRGEFASRKIHSTLVIVLVGVGVATVTDVEFNLIGAAFAAAAVFSTAQYQIWQGSKQREFGLSEMQLTMSVSAMQIVVGGALATLIEGKDVYGMLTGSAGKAMTPQLGAQILISCLLAVSANVHSFALIGRTSAVTFQVVGHGKTCLIIIAGYIMFPLPSLNEFLNNAFGVTLAVCGVVVYSNIKMNEGKSQDWCDIYLPQTCSRIMNPTSDYAKVVQKDIESSPSAGQIEKE